MRSHVWRLGACALAAGLLAPSLTAYGAAGGVDRSDVLTAKAARPKTTTPKKPKPRRIVLRGPRGLAGPRGAAGPQGLQGLAGPAGAAGTPGGTDAYTRAESDGRFVHGSTTEALVRVEVPSSSNATLVDLGSLGRLEGTCGPISTPPGTRLVPPAAPTAAIEVVGDAGVVDLGNPSLVLQVIDPAAPVSVDLPGTGQAYHAVVHVAQGVGPGARLAALEVTGFKIGAGTFPCRFTIKVTTAGL